MMVHSGIYLIYDWFFYGDVDPHPITDMRFTISNQAIAIFLLEDE